MRILVLMLVSLFTAMSVFAQDQSRLEDMEYFFYSGNPFEGDGLPQLARNHTIVERHSDGVIKSRAVFSDGDQPVVLYFAEHDTAGVISKYQAGALRDAAYARQARITKLNALLRASGHTGSMHYETDNEFRQFALRDVNLQERTLRFVYTHDRFVRWFRHLGMKYKIISERIDGTECSVSFSIDYTIDALDCDSSPNTNPIRREMYAKTLDGWDVLSNLAFRRLEFGEDKIPAFGVIVKPSQSSIEHKHIGPFPIPPEPAFLLVSRSKWITR